MSAAKTNFFTLHGTVRETEERYGTKGPYGYAKLHATDRSTGRSSVSTLLVFGAVYQALKDGWYDGRAGRFSLVRQGGTLVATKFEAA